MMILQKGLPLWLTSGLLFYSNPGFSLLRHMQTSEIIPIYEPVYGISFAGGKFNEDYGVLPEVWGRKGINSQAEIGFEIGIPELKVDVKHSFHNAMAAGFGTGIWTPFTAVILIEGSFYLGLPGERFTPYLINRLNFMNNIIEKKGYLFNTIAGGFCLKFSKTLSLFSDGGVGIPLSPMESSSGPVELFYICGVGIQFNRPLFCCLGCLGWSY